MSHDLRRRGSCDITIWILLLHSIARTIARDVTAKVVGSGALLAAWGTSIRQHSSDLSGISAHVENSHDRGDFGFNRKKDTEVAPANYRSMKKSMFLRKHLRIPFDPRHRLVKTITKHCAAI